jgi:hypothetical protein
MELEAGRGSYSNRHRQQASKNLMVELPLFPSLPRPPSKPPKYPTPRHLPLSMEFH